MVDRYNIQSDLYYIDSDLDNKLLYDEGYVSKNKHFEIIIYLIDMI